MQKHKEWLEFANEDLKVACILMQPDHMAVRAALYHAQQCAEKALKAYLIYKTKKQPPRTHDLTGLVERCMLIDELFSALKQDAFDINPFSVSTRYPADVYHLPFVEDAKIIIEQAEKVLCFVTDQLV